MSPYIKKKPLDDKSRTSTNIIKERRMYFVGKEPFYQCSNHIYPKDRPCQLGHCFENLQQVVFITEEKLGKSLGKTQHTSVLYSSMVWSS